MFGAILKATNSSFKKGMTFCRSIYVKKVMKLLAFIFEQPSYFQNSSEKLNSDELHIKEDFWNENLAFNIFLSETTRLNRTLIFGM